MRPEDWCCIKNYWVYRATPNCELLKGGVPQVANLLEVSHFNFKRFWRKPLNCATQEEAVSAISSSKRNNCGEKACGDG